MGESVDSFFTNCNNFFLIKVWMVLTNFDLVFFRVLFLLAPSLFTVKTILMIAFILKFETMSG